MSKLSTLPDLCVLAILDRVPVHDLYHTVPLVCKRWTNLHDTACHRRKTLILLECQGNLACAVDSKHRFDLLKYAVQEDGTPFKSETIPILYQNGCLVCPFYVAELSQLIRLTQLFPKVETLKIIQFNQTVFELNKLNLMLRSLSLGQSIKKLQLWVSIDPTDEEWDENVIIKLYISDIMERITSMSKTLKSLFINLSFPSEFQGNVTFDLKNLFKLESFSFDLNGLEDEHYDADESLRNLETYNLKTLRKIVITSPLRLESLIKLRPEMSRKFHDIFIDDTIVRENVENFKLFCTQFTSLTSVTVIIGASFFRQVIRSLTKLKQLIHLNVKINLNIEGEVDVDEEELEHKIPQLPSVVALSFFVQTKSHHDLVLLDLPAIMPNVQVVLLRHDSPHCTECGYGPFTMEQLELIVKEKGKMIEKIKQCMIRARISLIEFEMLKKLTVNILPMMFMIDEQTDYAFKLTRNELIDEL